MKKYLILSILLLSAYLNFAQDMRYKELIEIIKQGKDKEAFSVLFDFQKKNPEFANTYFQLGNISFKWTKNSDPLVDYDKTKQYIKNTKLFYSLGLAKITEQARDAKKYDDYYKTIPEFESVEKLENQMVIDYMNGQVKKTEEYETNTAEIVRLFHNIIKSYSKTKAAFTEFITANDNLNTIFTSPSKSTMDVTNKVIALYDSTLYFYEQYKTALANYPIKTYNQTLIEQPITTYRLEGMTGTNFLADTIYIWNYKKWAQSIQENLNSSIDHFRKTIKKTNKLIVDKDKELTKLTKPSSAYDEFHIDQIVGFEVEKYDYNSIISSLFKYRVKKVNYLIKSREFFNSREDTSYTPRARAVEYYNLGLDKDKVDSLLVLLDAKIGDETYMKHKYFFDENYGGLRGLKTFVTEQTNNNKQIYKDALSNFNYFIYRDVYMQSSDTVAVKYRTSDINLNVTLTKIKKAEKLKYYTLARASFNNINYVTGYYKSKIKVVPFIAKVANGKVEWLKLLKIPKSTTSFGVKISAQETSCALIVHSVNKSEHSNTFFQYGIDGKELMKKPMNSKKMPRFIHFDDINSNAIITFQGEELDYFAEKSDSLLDLTKFNTTSGDIEIDKTYILDGKMTNILKINAEYYLFANYKRLGFDKSILTEDTEKVGFMKLSETGDVEDLVKINTKKPVWAFYALKVNDKTISLATYKKKVNIYKTKFESLPEMYNVIISPKGKVIYEK